MKMVGKGERFVDRVAKGINGVTHIHGGISHFLLIDLFTDGEHKSTFPSLGQPRTIRTWSWLSEIEKRIEPIDEGFHPGGHTVVVCRRTEYDSVCSIDTVVQQMHPVKKLCAGLILSAPFAPDTTLDMICREVDIFGLSSY